MRPMAAKRRAAASARSKHTTASDDEPRFEEALEQLEEIVNQLEAGDLELEAALVAFEQGVALNSGLVFGAGTSRRLGAAHP